MSYDFKELGATLAIGICFLGGLHFLIWSFFGPIGRQFIFVRTKSGIPSSFRGAFLVILPGLAFATGMIVEDTSSILVDVRKSSGPLRPLASLGAYVLPAEKDLRMVALFGSTPRERVDRLAVEMSRNRRLEEYSTSKHAIDVSRSIRASEPPATPASTAALREIATTLYYIAKNTLFLHSTYYDELRGIQRRSDFARSATASSIFLLALSLLFSAVQGLRLAAAGMWPPASSNWLPAPRGWVLSPLTIEDHHSFTQPIVKKLLFGRAAIIVGSLMLALMASRQAFMIEELEFNRRVFGYFANLPPSHLPSSARPAQGNSPWPPGFSGIAALDKHQWVVVHDTKAASAHNAPYLGILDASGPASGPSDTHPTPTYRRLDVDFSTLSHPPIDIESICRVPRQAEGVHEFLAAESSSLRYGRIFHLVVTRDRDRWTARLAGMVYMPAGMTEVEGMACVEWSETSYLLLLGERGGRPGSHPQLRGLRLLRTGPSLGLDPRSATVLEAVPVSAPMTRADDAPTVRGCTDIHVDPNRNVWMAAAQDGGDAGPFRSVVYIAGRLNLKDTVKFEPAISPTAAWTFDGVKVEGLCGVGEPQALPCIATDDELFGGHWRLLLPAPR